jgi:hypothetical protein
LQLPSQICRKKPLKFVFEYTAKVLARALFISLIASACITFDPIQRDAACTTSQECTSGALCAGQACISPECLSNDECNGRVCLSGRCTTTTTDGSGNPKTLSVSAVVGTSSALDPNNKPRVRDRLRIEGGSIEEATAFQLIDKNGNVADLESTAFSGGAEVVIPAAFATSLREALGPSVDLRIEHPTLGSLVKRLEIRRGEQGPVGPTGDPGDTGAPGRTFPGQPTACGNLGLGVMRSSGSADLQCVAGRNNVLLSAIGGTPPVFEIGRSAPATAVAVATGSSTALQLEHVSPSSTSLQVIGSSNFLEAPPFNEPAVRLPIYMRFGTVTDSVGTEGRALDGTSAPDSMCDIGDIMLAGSCSSTGRLFADCPTVDRLATTCLSGTGTASQALGLRCRADDSQPPVGTIVQTRAWIVCLRRQ